MLRERALCLSALCIRPLQHLDTETPRHTAPLIFLSHPSSIVRPGLLAMNLWRSSKRTPRDSSADKNEASVRFSTRPAPMEPTIEEHEAMPPQAEINRMRARAASDRRRHG